MIALKLTDQFQTDLELSLTSNPTDDKKNVIQLSLNVCDYDDDEKWKDFYFNFESKIELNQFISWLVAYKKQISD